MKYLIIVGLFFLKISEGMSQEIVSIKLTEQTRGFQREIVVSEKEVNRTENGVSKKKNASVKSWNSIVGLCKSFPLAKMESFIPPSSNRASDGALHSVLEIQTKEKTFHSQTFDNDNPPKELKALVQALGKM